MEGIRYLDHDADLGFEVIASSREQLWDRGARALTGVMTDPASVATNTAMLLEVDGPDLAAVWVASLAELLYRFEVEGMLLPAIDRLELAETGEGLTVRFRARGEPFDPDRHAAEASIKAVTHHGAVVERLPDGRWRGRVLLDL